MVRPLIYNIVSEYHKMRISEAQNIAHGPLAFGADDGCLGWVSLLRSGVKDHSHKYDFIPEIARKNRCGVYYQSNRKSYPTFESYYLKILDVRRIRAIGSFLFFFHFLIWFGWTSNWLAISAMVRSPLMASKATPAMPNAVKSGVSGWERNSSWIHLIDRWSSPYLRCCGYSSNSTVLFSLNSVYAVKKHLWNT